MQTDQRLDDASQDDLIAIVDACESLSWSRFHHEASEEEWALMMKLKQNAVGILKTKYGLNDQGIRNAWEEWNERTLRKEYDESFCAQCPRSPGYERYKELGGKVSCKGPNGDFATVCKLPQTKDRCIWERQYDHSQG